MGKELAVTDWFGNGINVMDDPSVKMLLCRFIKNVTMMLMFFFLLHFIVFPLLFS